MYFKRWNSSKRHESYRHPWRISERRKRRSSPWVVAPSLQGGQVPSNRSIKLYPGAMFSRADDNVLSERPKARLLFNLSFCKQVFSDHVHQTSSTATYFSSPTVLLITLRNYLRFNLQALKISLSLLTTDLIDCLSYNQRRNILTPC